MGSDVDDLLRAMHEAPNDFTLPLILADALEEEGRPREAELTRLSHRLNRWRVGPESPDWGEAVAAQVRQRDLLLSGVRPVRPTLVNPLGMEFKLIPAGSYFRGSCLGATPFSSYQPVRWVTITRPFYLCSTPTTVAHVRAMADSYGLPHPASWGKLSGGDLHHRDWGWRQFASRLNVGRKLSTPGWFYTLHTEAEWEYACRGPHVESWSFWYDKESPKRHLQSPNAWGLWQLHGPAQICADFYNDRYYSGRKLIDPKCPPSDEVRRRSVRGARIFDQDGECHERFFTDNENRCCFRLLLRTRQCGPNPCP